MSGEVAVSAMRAPLVLFAGADDREGVVARRLAEGDISCCSTTNSLHGDERATLLFI